MNTAPAFRRLYFVKFIQEKILLEKNHSTTEVGKDPWGLPGPMQGQ